MGGTANAVPPTAYLEQTSVEIFESKLLESMWGQYKKIVSKYPAFKDFKPFRTNNWVYIQKLQENTPPLEQKRGISMNFFSIDPQTV